MKLTMFYVPMRDGTKLFTRVWKPEAEGSYPVVYVRSPYDDPKTYAQQPEEADCVYVMQSCRGTAASQGEIIAYFHEREDGLDTLEWIRQQEFYTGEIYVSGASYLSTVHLMYLDTCPPDVRGGMLKIQDCDRYNIHYENGQYKHGLHYGWAVGNLRKRHPECLGAKKADEALLTLPAIGFRDRILQGLGIATLDECYEAFEHPEESDPYWKTRPGVCDGLKAPESIRFPLFLSTGHYDIYVRGIPKMWAAMRPEVRAKSLFVITPYNHSWTGAGQRPFENDRSDFLKRIDPVWMEYCRTGEWDASCGFEIGKCNYYVLFGGRWIAEEFLNDGAKRGSLPLGPGSLGEASTGEASYVYDPDHPTSFRGCCGNVFGVMEPQDGIGTKADALSFLSKPFEETVTLKGVQSLRLRVKSDCEDTAFYARVSLVKADGTTYAFRDRITALRYALGDYAPGSEAELCFDFDPVAVEIKAGEALRLDVASANWPAYVPHSNTAEKWCEAKKRKIARNTVLFAGSELTLRYE